MTTLRKGSGINDIFAATDEAEAFDGAGGYDVVTYATAKKKVVIDLLNAAHNDGAAAGDTYLSIESFKLSVYDDVFKGSNANDVVNGDAGNDILEGRGGNDSLTGHSGNDTIRGGDGNDSIWGGGDADALFGDAGNDQIWGDAGNDVITGGADDGAHDARIVSETFYELPGGSRVALAAIDDVGEWALVPKFHNVTGASGISVLGRVDGDVIYVVTNGFADARDWNGWRGGQSPLIDLGPGGEIPAGMSVVFNAGGGNSALQFKNSEAGAPKPLNPNAAKGGAASEGKIVTESKTVVGSVTFGDILTGGTGNDTFVFNLGDGVDRITDFVKGQDRIDIDAAYFDGAAANGEFAVVDYAGGALILFRDGSADGFADDAGIFLAGLKAASIDATVFV